MGDAMTATAQDQETAWAIFRFDRKGPPTIDAIASALAVARREEREACAKVVESAMRLPENSLLCGLIVDAIRARTTGGE